MTRTLRLFYAAGPGNVIGTFRHWQAGRDDPSQVSMTYSGQFLDLCRELSAEGYIVSSHPHRALICEGPFTLEHLPKPWSNARGPFYHLAALWYGMLIMARALRFGADAAVIAEGTTDWFVLSLLSRCGVKVIPALHCMLWPKHQTPGNSQHLINRINRLFFSRWAWGILSASDDINRQINLVAGGRPRPIFDFLPTYRRKTFAAVQPPRHDDKPFHVLFAGRIERDKGVFDLLEIARRFAREGHHGISFDLCGDGSVLDTLRAAVAREGVDPIFHLHGYCLKPQMQAMLNRSQVLIVPTTTSFIEGFNQVVVEGILAGRPVITSSVCPALDYVRDAVVEVQPNDIAGYSNAILALKSDEGLYERKREACLKYQEQFYSPQLGWIAALRKALRGIEQA
jgi:glycosyltransferase involved in cell wall biosynthesis